MCLDSTFQQTHQGLILAHWHEQEGSAETSSLNDDLLSWRVSSSTAKQTLPLQCIVDLSGERMSLHLAH